MSKYFILTNSNESLSKRFRVVAEGYVEDLDKKQDIQTTVDGNLDVSEGSIFKSWSFLVRVRETETDEDYGTLDELKQFYLYNNPNGAVTNVLTLTDHFGNEHPINFYGKLSLKPFASVLIGTEAWYWIPVTFIKIIQETPAGGSGS